jgi:type VI secretion system secreted protein VgrG
VNKIPGLGTGVGSIGSAGGGGLDAKGPDATALGGAAGGGIGKLDPSALKLDRAGLKLPLGDSDPSTETHDPVVLRMENLPPGAQVHRMRGDEAISATYRYRVSVVVPVGASVLEDYEETLVGHRATIVLTHAGAQREIQGIVVQASVEGMLDEHEVSLAVDVVPEMALLGMRVHSRIVQDKSAIDVVKDVLDEWGLEVDVQLNGEYATRAYVTQYQESDLAFVERLLASEGVAYFFVAGENKEKIVLVDAASSYAPVVSSSGGPPVLGWAYGEMKTGEFLVRVRTERRLRPTASRIGDFDFRKPGLVLRNIALAESEQAAFVKTFGAEQLAVYRHGDTVETADGGKLDGDERRARVALAQHRRDVEMLFGATRGRRMAPGHVFTMARHPVERLNRDWAVTRMTVKLDRPRRQGGEAPEEYEASFECVPADHLLRPAVPPRRVRQVSETATVVGPRGEALHADEHGRIKVKFHWDLSARDDDSASCWLHVSQGWVGANWGSQFVPRVGTEVVVTFLGGDPDRPLVTGSVYNGTHPPPFPLPGEITKSGLRTQSTPGGSGYNELSFDDRTGSELVHLRAERDLELVAQNDAREEIGRDRDVHVKRDLKQNVDGAHTLRVVGGSAVMIEKNRDEQIGGDAVLAVSGNYDVRVSTDRTTRVEGRDRTDVEEVSTTTYHEDQIVRVLGHRVTVVGEADAQRSSSLHVEGTASSYSTGLTEIASEKVLVLRCGESAIRLTPTAVEIFGPRVFLQGEVLHGLFDDQVNLHAKKRANLTSDRRVHLAGQVAAVDLMSDARIDGTQVKLNCSPEPDAGGEEDPPRRARRRLAARRRDGRRRRGGRAARRLGRDLLPRRRRRAEAVTGEHGVTTEERVDHDRQHDRTGPPLRRPQGRLPDEARPRDGLRSGVGVAAPPERGAHEEASQLGHAQARRPRVGARRGAPAHAGRVRGHERVRRARAEGTARRHDQGRRQGAAEGAVRAPRHGQAGRIRRGRGRRRAEGRDHRRDRRAGAHRPRAERPREGGRDRPAAAQEAAPAVRRGPRARQRAVRRPDAAQEPGLPRREAPRGRGLRGARSGPARGRGARLPGRPGPRADRRRRRRAAGEARGGPRVVIAPT